MPYVRQRTRIQMAPRSFMRRGLGSIANCPSLQQLQGIVDPTDPCQAGNAYAAITSSLGPGQCVDPLSGITVPCASIPGSPATPAGTGQTFTQWFQQNQNLVVWGGAGLFGLLLLKKMLR